MFCRKCGSELLEDSQFCSVCGAKVEIKKNAGTEKKDSEKSEESIAKINKKEIDIKKPNEKKSGSLSIIIGAVCGLLVIAAGIVVLERIESEKATEEQYSIKIASIYCDLGDTDLSNDESAKQRFVDLIDSGYTPGTYATKGTKDWFNQLYKIYEAEGWGHGNVSEGLDKSVDAKNKQTETLDSQILTSSESQDEQLENMISNYKEEDIATPEIDNEWAFPGELYEGGIPEETYQIIKGTYYGEAWVCTLEILSPTDIRYTDGESSLLKVFKTELGESGELLLYIGEGKKPDGRILSVYYIPDSDKTGISIYDGGRGDYNQSHVTRSLGRITTEVGEKRPWQDEYDEYFGGCRLIEEGGNYYLCRLHSKTGIKISDDAVVGVAKEIFTNWNEEECYEEVQYYYSYVPFYENVDQLFETGHWFSNDYSDLGWDSDNLSFEVKEYQLMNCPLVKYNEEGEINLIIDYYAP